MIIKYKYGFEFKGVLFGWKEKELYRLPQMIGKRFYPLKKCGSYEDVYTCKKLNCEVDGKGIPSNCPFIESTMEKLHQLAVKSRFNGVI